MVARTALIGIVAGAVATVAVGIGFFAYQPSSQPGTITPPAQAPEVSQGVFPEALAYTITPVPIDQQKGYSVLEIADGVYWVVGSGYQTMFLTTSEGVIAVDAPQPIGEKYIQAIKDTTDEPIKYVIYSHHHQDHTGAAADISG